MIYLSLILALLLLPRSLTFQVSNLKRVGTSTTRIYARQQRLAQNENNSGATPDRRQESLNVGNNPLLSLNLNLDALARAQASERAQELYQRIAALHREGYYAVSPDTVSFNSVLKAWQHNPAKALEFWEQEASSQTPNVRSYNTFLLALANAGLYEDAHELLEALSQANSAVVPDRITYNTVLLAYANGARTEATAAPRAEKLLQEMIAGEGCFAQPDTLSFNTVITAWANHLEEDVSVRRAAAERAEYWLRHEKLRADVVSYSSVIHAWSKCDASRALRLWKEMQEQTELQPTAVTYTAVLQALCQQGTPELADQVLRDLLDKRDARVDVVTISVVLDGWASVAEQRPDDAVSAVQSLLETMNKYHRQGWKDIAPTAQTYTSALSAIARSRRKDAGFMAQAILKEISLPTVIHHNAVMDAFAKSQRADKAIQAYKVLNSMDVEPDIISYNTVLAAASQAFGPYKEESLQIALDVIQQIFDTHDMRPSSLTFHYGFKAVRRLMVDSPQKKSSTKRLFQLCCEYGCLNEIILDQVLNRMLPSHELLGDGSPGVPLPRTSGIKLADLPAAWSKHAMKPRRRTMLS